MILIIGANFTLLFVFHLLVRIIIQFYCDKLGCPVTYCNRYFSVAYFGFSECLEGFT